MMRSRPTSAVPLLLLLLLAGCSGATTEGGPVAETESTGSGTPSASSVVSYAPPPSSSGGPDPDPAAEIGIVRGTVVDDQKLPLGNVTVEVDSGATQALTNESGGFEVRDLPVGPHTFIFHAPRYFPAERTVEVLADEVVEVRVELQLDPESTEPHLELQQQNGVISCQVWVGSAGCTNPGASHQNSHKFLFPFSGLNMTIMEIVWTPQSDTLAGAGLQDLQLQLFDCTGANLLGTSGLRHITFRLPTPKTPTPRSGVCVAEPNLAARIDVAPLRINQGDPPGIVVGDQRYTFYVSLAYHFIPAEDYTAKPA